MATDTGLNSLLKWGIENSNPADASDKPTGVAGSSLNEEALRQLMGGPSDADLMKQSMTVITHPDATHESRMVAFDNLEQLVESIDNANNMEPLGLWTPLLGQLESLDADMRRMAAWCVGTSVQNNIKAQERFLAVNGIPILCKLVVEEQDKATKKKAVYALSSAVRNYQPGMNEAVKYLPTEIVGRDQISATDMDAIDAVMTQLRERQ